MRAVDSHLNPQSLLEVALPATPAHQSDVGAILGSRDALQHALLQLQALASLTHALVPGPGALKVSCVGDGMHMSSSVAPMAEWLRSLSAIHYGPRSSLYSPAR